MHANFLPLESDSTKVETQPDNFPLEVLGKISRSFQTATFASCLRKPKDKISKGFLSFLSYWARQPEVRQSPHLLRFHWNNLLPKCFLKQFNLVDYEGNKNAVWLFGKRERRITAVAAAANLVCRVITLFSALENDPLLPSSPPHRRQKDG